MENEAKKEAVLKHVNDAIQSETKDGKVIVIREGKAEEIKYKNKIRLVGVLAAPYEFFEKRVLKNNLHDPNKCHVVYDLNKQTIRLVVDEQAENENFEITGKLTNNPDLLNFGINSTCSQYTIKEAMSLLKMNRMFFLEKDVNAKIVNQLQNFKAKVVKELEDVDDLRGNNKLMKMQKLETELELSFDLLINIFKGYGLNKIKVDILFHVKDNDVMVYFESRDLKELESELTHKLVMEQVDKFKENIVCIEQ